MGKTSSSETIRLREGKKRKEEKVREERSKYYQENKESINRKRREKQQKAKETVKQTLLITVRQKNTTGRYINGDNGQGPKRR